MKLMHYLISGRVQGVGFRAFTQMEAKRVGITGWVRNLSDGRVEVLARGTEEQIYQFTKVLVGGPPVSKVENIQQAEVMPVEVTASFEILASGGMPWSG